ncbi:tyrosine-type recombinase/integrase [Thermoflavimicrobium daqui]|uniref:Site-specific integrase n=1 Tax=Thermoflavimicrobium daqui TaxID=2137476 RepID=A0A364K208_9BACL|nr:tyrosine-type recombinase/integrase [Thermoflavimicrobium daqui]RAL21963.1 site-specific integrase [Thermoflavimicrobium daqui]
MLLLPHKAMIRLMLQAGLRVSEVANLELDDYKKWGSEGTIDIRQGKGGKMDTVKAVKDICRAIDEWLEVRESQTNAMFISNRGEKMSRQAIHKQVKPYLEQITGNEDITIHSLRHTFCKNLLDATNGDLSLVLPNVKFEEALKSDEHSFSFQKINHMCNLLL